MALADLLGQLLHMLPELGFRARGWSCCHHIVLEASQLGPRAQEAASEVRLQGSQKLFHLQLTTGSQAESRVWFDQQQMQMR